MKLKAVGFHLLYAFADATFRLQASQFAVKKITLKIDIDAQIGDDSKKGPPGIKTVDLAYLNGADLTLYPDIIIKKNEFNQIKIYENN